VFPPLANLFAKSEIGPYFARAKSLLNSLSLIPAMGFISQMRKFEDLSVAAFSFYKQHLKETRRLSPAQLTLDAYNQKLTVLTIY